MTDMSRRRFMGVTTAVGGGLCFLGDPASASIPERSALETWERWRGTQPRRLSEATHTLAQRALSGEHGRALVTAGFSLDGAEVAGLSSDMRYAYAARLVAEKAPLRILPGERIIGAATMREGAAHQTPVAGVTSTSHTTLGFHKVLETGYKGLRKQVAERLGRGDFDTFEVPQLVEAGPAGPAYAPGRLAGSCMTAAARTDYDTPPLTVECQARLDSSAGFNVVVANRDKSSRHHWELYSYMGSGCLSAYLPGYAPAEIVSSHSVTDGEWHHLAMTFDGAHVALFVDGALVHEADVTPTHALGEGGGAFYLGGFGPAGTFCNGLVGAVRLSRGVLPISTDAMASFEPGENSLGLWHPVDTDRGTRMEDQTVHANHAYAPAPQGGRDLLESMALCLDAADIWRQRHLDELAKRVATTTGEEREQYLRLHATLQRVPENPPETFEEAVQSLWFMYAFQRLMGTWSGIGRIDDMLGPYLERDLAEGRITLAEARELMAHFWIKGCEWIGANEVVGSGDAQHYQNIILGGVDAEGREVTNEVTYLVLDMVEELHISDFPIAVRLNAQSPRRLLERMAEVQRHGGGVVAMYNEDVVIDGLVKFGYPVEEARTFTNDGCWEVLIPGRTTFAYSPFDALVFLSEVLGVLENGEAVPAYTTFDDLYGAYLARLGQHIEAHHRGADGWARSSHPTPLVSLFVEDCIESGRSYMNRGARYTVLAPHAGRLANVSNSLLAIKTLVYDEQRLSLAALVDILRENWEGQESLRQRILNRIPTYGNDDDAADAMMARLFNDYAALVARVPEREGVKRPCGISTFGREIGWSMDPNGSKATADGHHQGAVLATNFSPSPGTDRLGPTAVLQSYCKMDFTRTPNGATVELKVHPESVRGEAGRDALVGLMRTFVTLGGMFMHIDVVDSDLLKEAQAHPEQYPNLAVRISGWSARFVTLDKHWQDMIIQRTQQYA